MKKVIMIFAVLASISFAANKEYNVVEEMPGGKVKVQKVENGEISVVERSEAIKLGIIGEAPSISLSDSFINSFMPSKNDPVVGKPQSPVKPPMEVVNGTVTTAYGAK